MPKWTFFVWYFLNTILRFRCKLASFGKEWYTEGQRFEQKDYHFKGGTLI